MKRCFHLAVLAIVLSTVSVRSEPVPFDSERWEIEAEEHTVEEHLGRTSLFLKNGSAWIDDDDFLDGEIEFDVAFTGERGFMGAGWRKSEPDGFEQFYLRPHQSGNPDANQYTPVFNGVSGWQLYHGEGYGAPVEYPLDQWIHVRIVVAGERGEVYIDSDEPVLVMHDLKRKPRRGRVGLTSFFAPGHFTGFSYSKQENPVLKGTPRKPPATPAGTVMRWLVSGPFDERRLEGAVTEMNGLTFTPLEAEPGGITNLARLSGSRKGSNTVFARLILDSEREQTKELRFGYSDRVQVYLNARRLYAGSNDYRSRDYRYLGTIGLFDTLYLPLEKGRNELWLAVSESFGGWGVIASLADREGLAIVSDP